MSNQSLIKSLYRREIKVLYWKCKGEQYQQIALRFIKKDGSPYTDEWVQKQVTSAYKRLLFPPDLSKEEKSDYLDQRFCEEILKFTEEELGAWPIQGWKAVEKESHTVYEVKTEKDLPKGKETEFRQLSESVEPAREDDIPQTEDTDQSFDDADEEEELESSGRNEIEDVEEKQEESSQKLSPEPIPPTTDPATPSPSSEPKRGFEWRPPPNQPLNRLWLLVPALICIACVGLAWLARDRLLPIFMAEPDSTPTFTPSFAPTNASTDTPRAALPTETLLGSPTPVDTSTPEPSPTLEETAALEIPPTAVSLPIREDFSQQYSDLWTVIGNPLVTENIEFGSFSGVLTTGFDDTAKLLIGNTAWTDYLVSVQVSMPFRESYFIIGVRVIDINNMIALECSSYGQICNWAILYQGEREQLPTDRQMGMLPLTITVQGDTFTALGGGLGTSTTTMSFVLPPKYKGKFPGGGVILQIISNLEVDYIQIDPLP